MRTISAKQWAEADNEEDLHDARQALEAVDKQIWGQLQLTQVDPVLDAEQLLNAVCQRPIPAPASNSAPIASPFLVYQCL